MQVRHVTSPPRAIGNVVKNPACGISWPDPAHRGRRPSSMRMPRRRHCRRRRSMKPNPPWALAKTRAGPAEFEPETIAVASPPEFASVDSEARVSAARSRPELDDEEAVSLVSELRASPPIRREVPDPGPVENATRAGTTLSELLEREGARRVARRNVNHVERGAGGATGTRAVNEPTSSPRRRSTRRGSATGSSPCTGPAIQLQDRSQPVSSTEARDRESHVFAHRRAREDVA